MTPWSVTLTGDQWAVLRQHLFPGDGDEHGAILRCGIASTPTGVRLLVRDVVLARDGVDYVPGRYGYRMLTEEFVLDNITVCDTERLAYLAVHCHGGQDEVGFSRDDLASHARGYPALLGISRGMPVGALVFAKGAVAGDVWLGGGSRVEVKGLRVVGRPRIWLQPQPSKPQRPDPTYDRQSRLFGDRGQEILRQQKVAIVGLGGGGSIANELIARLGVGRLVHIDPDRVDVTNLPRIVAARRVDALPWLSDEKRPKWVRIIGRRLRASKVSVAKRVVRQAAMGTRVTSIVGSVDDPTVAAHLLDCDQVFLAADTAVARHLVNAIAHQYLVPVTQIGAKVSVDAAGALTDVFSVSRASTPGNGCMWCNGLINPDRLRVETTPREILEQHRYVDDVAVVAPSVVSLNAVGAAAAVNEWLMSVTGLTREDGQTLWQQMDAATGEHLLEIPRRDAACRECGSRRFAKGDAIKLPTR
jgi:hypothetical protein